MTEVRKKLEEFVRLTVPLRLQPISKRAYVSAWRRWMEFCVDTGRSWRDWNNAAVEQFIAWRRTTGHHYNPVIPVKGKTIGANSSGIRSILMAEGVRPREFTAITMPRAAVLLTAIKKQDLEEVGGRAPGKLPLTSKHLKRMEVILRRQGANGRVFAFYLAISHNTLRRSAEVLREDVGGMTTEMIKWENGSTFSRLENPLDETASLIFNKSKRNHRGRTQTAFM